MTIDEAVDRIPFLSRAAHLSVSPLPGGVTNENYRVDADGEAFVVRIAAEGAAMLGVDRRRERRCLATAGRIGVGPTLVYALPRDGVLVTRFIKGRALTPGKAVSPVVRARVVRTMRRYHRGPAIAGSFSPWQTLRVYRRVARSGRASLPLDIDRLYEQIGRVARALRRTRGLPRPCHNDLWGPNLIDDGRRIWIVDWEYAGMGDIYFDLANFAIYHCPTDAADAALLAAYFGRVRREAMARLKLMRIVAALREAMWYVVALRLLGARRHFARTAGTLFTRCRTALEDPRVPAWLQTVAPHG